MCYTSLCNVEIVYVTVLIWRNLICLYLFGKNRFNSLFFLLMVNIILIFNILYMFWLLIIKSNYKTTLGISFKSFLWITILNSVNMIFYTFNWFICKFWYFWQWSYRTFIFFFLLLYFFWFFFNFLIYI
jgi:hypothetical protein